MSKCKKKKKQTKLNKRTDPKIDFIFFMQKKKFKFSFDFAVKCDLDMFLTGFMKCARTHTHTLWCDSSNLSMAEGKERF